MAQSLAQLYVHLIFGTHNRESLLHDSLRDEMHQYMCGILKRMDSSVVSINSVGDHVHILLHMSRNHALAKIIEEVKRALRSG